MATQEALLLGLTEAHTVLRAQAAALATIGPALAALTNIAGTNWDSVVEQLNRNTDNLERVGKALEGMTAITVDLSGGIAQGGEG